MTLNLNLKPIWLPVLTTQPWMLHVVSQLGDPLTSRAGLVGVDIGHVDIPGLVASEACVGFVARGSRIEATCMQYRDDEAEKFDRIQQSVTANIVPSRMSHWALCDKSPQINTLVFRTFTLAYTPDFQRREPAQAAKPWPRLIMHDAARLLKPHDLSDKVQACLNAFTAAHDAMAGTTLMAPDALEFERHFENASA